MQTITETLRKLNIVNEDDGQVNNGIIYGIVKCDSYDGSYKLSEKDMLDILGYDSIEELNEEEELEIVDEDALRDYFVDYCDIDFEDAIKECGLKILKKEDISYYEGGYLFNKMQYKIKGPRKGFKSLETDWFVVDSEEVDVEKLFVNYDD